VEKRDRPGEVSLPDFELGSSSFSWMICFACLVKKASQLLQKQQSMRVLCSITLNLMRMGLVNRAPTFSFYHYFISWVS
jgi:hypothetical protein